jgi:dienelactone hydrolase
VGKLPLFYLIFVLSLCSAFGSALGGPAGFAVAQNAEPQASPNPIGSPKGFVVLELRIPSMNAPRGLQALLVRPDDRVAHPLAIITHGYHHSAQVRRAISPQYQLPVAMEFARRGFTAVIVMRRGYGGSDGRFAEAYPFAERRPVCDLSSYVAWGNSAADDLRAAISFLAKRSDVDARHIISVGESGGGFATVALTVNPPGGLVAAINFAGGSWMPRSTICEDSLVAAFRFYGGRSRTPMLWVYSENDPVFWPEIAKRFHSAFIDAGGQARFIQAPPIGDNGHALVSLGIPIWTAYVDEFMRSQKLPLPRNLLAVPQPVRLPPPQPPRELAASDLSYFQEYLAAKGEKALAVSPTGKVNYASGFLELSDAEESALGLCESHGERCRIAFLNNYPIP